MNTIIIKYISVLCFLCFSITVMAQNYNDRDYIRKGNRLYNDSLYEKSEVEYRKAIDLNPQSSQAYYNLGNALVMQGKAKDAMEAYENALKFEKSKSRLAYINHNMGVIFQAQKQFAPAIECYKNALRNNPKDNETRYNLALCQHQLKNNPQENNQQQENKEDKKQEQQQQQQQEQEQQQQKSEKEEQKQNESNISKENAEQLLKAVMEDEKKTQEKLNKATQQHRSRRLEKQW